MANVAQQFRQFSVMEHQASGMDMPILLDMGMEAMTARLVINGYFGSGRSTGGR